MGCDRHLLIGHESKETRLLRRIDEYEGILKETNALIRMSKHITDEFLRGKRQERLQKLKKDAEEGLAEEKLAWNEFIRKERTPKKCRPKKRG